MKNYQLGIIALAGALSLFAASAEALELSAVSGINYAGTTTTPTDAADLRSVNGTSTVGTGFPVGALIGYSPAHNWDLETGLVYSTNTTSHTTNVPDGTELVGAPIPIVGTTSDTYHYLQLPVVARYRVLSFLGVGGGFYYGRGVGQVAETTTGTAPGINGTKSFGGENGANLKQDDFGAIFSLHAAYPITKGISALLDTRFLLGLTNDSTTAEASRYRAAQVLAGLSIDLDRFGFGSSGDRDLASR